MVLRFDRLCLLFLLPIVALAATAEQSTFATQWIEKVNPGTAAYYLSLYDAHTTPDFRFNNFGVADLMGVGAREYNLVLWDFSGGPSDPNFGTDKNSVFVLRNKDVINSHVWLSSTVLQHKFIANLTLNYTAFGGPYFSITFLEATEQLTFVDETSLILTSDINWLGDLYLQALEQNGASLDAATICALNGIFCTDSNQIYDSFADCMAFMTQIPAKGICPTAQDSNTTNCRGLHQLVANVPLIVDPNVQIIHCPHVAPDSMMCVDRCLPSCSNCDVNAHCDFTSGPFDTPAWGCFCNEGYSGTGTAGNCAPVTCSSEWQCLPLLYNTCNTTLHRCECVPSFTWNSVTGRCECDSTTHFVKYGGPNGPECIPKGNCRAIVDCVTQVGDNILQSSCATVPNPYTTLGVCLCNEGFAGGLSTPCQCLSPGTIRYSTTLHRSVCLQPGQCTNNLDCWVYDNTLSCTVTGPSPIGTCA